jgi:hypothetical protein
MNEILTFFKELFLCDEVSCNKIGLSQFKSEKTEKQVKKVVKSQKEVKLSDLMKRGA